MTYPSNAFGIRLPFELGTEQPSTCTHKFDAPSRYSYTPRTELDGLIVDPGPWTFPLVGLNLKLIKSTWSATRSESAYYNRSSSRLLTPWRTVYAEINYRCRSQGGANAWDKPCRRGNQKYTSLGPTYFEPRATTSRSLGNENSGCEECRHVEDGQSPCCLQESYWQSFAVLTVA